MSEYINVRRLHRVSSECEQISTKKQDKPRRLAVASGHLEANVALNTSRLCIGIWVFCTNVSEYNY